MLLNLNKDTNKEQRHRLMSFQSVQHSLSIPLILVVKLICLTADAMVSTGLSKLGYQYVNIGTVLFFCACACVFMQLPLPICMQTLV